MTFFIPDIGFFKPSGSILKRYTWLLSESTMQKLINQDGNIEFGVYTEAPYEVNFKDYHLRNAMDKTVTGWRKKMRFNQFQFISLNGDDFILGVAIVNLKWVSNCFVYVYQPSSQTFKEFSWLQPFAFNTQTDALPNNGEWHFKYGKSKIAISSNNGQRHLHIHIPNELDVNVHINEQQPALNVCCQAGYDGWVYTQKNAALPVSGDIQWQQNTINAKTLKAAVDWSCGYMRRETFWNWASLSHTTQTGDVIGFNLATGVNETSFTENNLWINGKSIKLDRAQFKFNRNNRMAPWEIKSCDGLIDLKFTPMGERKEKINAILIASNFTQVFGEFHGTVKDKLGNTYKIENALGFCEDHYAKW